MERTRWAPAPLPKAIIQRLNAAQNRRSRLARRVLLVVECLFVIGGSAVATWAQLSDFDKDGASAIQVAGLIATPLIALGAVILIFFRQDVDDELAIAREAVEAARESESLGVVLSLQEERARVVNLYQAVMEVRRSLETATLGGEIYDDALIEQLLDNVAPNLRVALGFTESDTWTICLYRPEPMDGGIELVCKAHDRKIRCELHRARRWRPGEGACGVAFSRRKELILEDTLAPELKDFVSCGDQASPHDARYYRSIAAIPIIVDDRAEPYAVLVATSSEPNHFTKEAGAGGVKTVEGVRAFAQMLELMIAIRRRKAPPRRKT